ncbi:hypothetical protein TD95_003165 [Thielaviopsis punctulata]|uniref:Uncharacterized protein n=1 Tax=Thielaviopsis punctulata TaxID=72032 RepID=A0A0F4ZAB4_9PEZI|nr:hypothetical protein TD95_003165 [Thielaviopsis punctulata]
MSFQTSTLHLQRSVRAALQRMPTRRAFGSSPAVYHINDRPPPESPSFIPVERPPLSPTEPLAPTRGHIPIPRSIFHPSEGDRKVTEEYLEKTAANPSNEASKSPAKDGSAEDWRRKMAATRRENLKAGLKGLWERKVAREERREAKKLEDLKYSEAARNSKPHLTETLTQSTILKATALDTAVLPDPDRMERAEKSRIRTAQLQSQYREARRDHLVELYSKATKFIVNEAQLQQEIDRLFSDSYWKTEPGFYDDGNAWASWGQPPSIDNMLNEYANAGNPSPYYSSKAGSTHNAMRQKQVAQQLTGGKLL